MTTSSTYMKALSLIFGCRICSRPRLSASLRRAFNPSMTRTNNRGDRGSPCRSPLAWQILVPGHPFRITFVLAVDMREIQSSHRQENPRCWSRLSKNCQLTVSKAFTMSTFRRAFPMSTCKVLFRFTCYFVALTIISLVPFVINKSKLDLCSKDSFTSLVAYMLN